jgi:hypothetical protein
VRELRRAHAAACERVVCNPLFRPAAGAAAGARLMPQQCAHAVRFVADYLQVRARAYMCVCVRVCVRASVRAHAVQFIADYLQVCACACACVRACQRRMVDVGGRDGRGPREICGRWGWRRVPGRFVADRLCLCVCVLRACVCVRACECVRVRARVCARVCVRVY